MLVLLDGRAIPPSEAKIPISSPAFQYGFGLFETLRTYPPGGLFRVGAHLERLRQGAQEMGLPLAHPPEQLAAWLKLMARRTPQEPRRIKLTAIPGHTLITSLPLNIDRAIYHGVGLVSQTVTRPFPTLKALAYLDSFLPHQRAVAAGGHDALLVDAHGQVYEGAYSNLFWVKEGRLYTRQAGVLQGITRQAVVECSPVAVEYAGATLEGLHTVDELFITQTSSGVVPVVRLDGKEVADGQPGPLTRRVMEAFEKLVRQETTPSAHPPA